jgi:2Fe-2S ferredoxin
MGTIVVKNLESKTIDCAGKKERLLDILLEETDWMHACGGKGRCTTCKAIFHKGQDQLHDLTKNEERFAKLGKLSANERLSCQVVLKGDENLEISVAEENKLPHISYSN